MQFFLPLITLMAPLFFQAVMATNGKPMWSGTVTANVHGPTAEQVWPYFEDWCNFYRIYPPDASFCINGVPSPTGQIGQQRYIATKLAARIGNQNRGSNSSYISWEKHILTGMYPSKRTLTYESLENINIPPNTTLKSTMSVLPRKNGCQIVWSYVIDPLEGYTSEALRTLEFLPVQKKAANIIRRLFKKQKN